MKGPEPAGVKGPSARGGSRAIRGKSLPIRRMRLQKGSGYLASADVSPTIREVGKI